MPTRPRDVPIAFAYLVATPMPCRYSLPGDVPLWLKVNPLRDVPSLVASLAPRCRAAIEISVAVPECLPEDEHIQNAVNVAEQLARGVDGAVIYDVAARRSFSPSEFADAIEPGVEDHVSYLEDGASVVTAGMVKFGLFETRVVIPSTRALMQAATVLLDTIASGLVAGAVNDGKAIVANAFEFLPRRIGRERIVDATCGAALRVLEDVAEGIRKRTI